MLLFRLRVMVVQLSYSDLQCILCWQASNSSQDLKAPFVGFHHEDRSIGFGTRQETDYSYSMKSLFGEEDDGLFRCDKDSRTVQKYVFET